MEHTESNRFFPTLSGNDEVKARLGADILAGTLPHALLIAGAEGSGRHTLALLLAEAANCERAGDRDVPLPCGTCRTCRRIAEGKYPDVKTLGKSAGKATVGVEELRLFREDMFLSATEAMHRFYIIENAEDMTAAAQNALLKVLEEPPAGVHILLITDGADRMLSTIRSRAQTIRTARLGKQELSDALRRRSPDADALARQDPDAYEALLLAADGRMGRALDMLDPARMEDTRRDRESVDAVIAAMDRRVPYATLLTAVRGLPEKRDELSEVLEDILTAIRDMIAVSRTDAPPLYFLSRERAADAAEKIGERRLFRLADIIDDAVADNERNVIVSTLLTDLSVRIRLA